GEIRPNEISLDLVADIEKLKPFGIGNEEPIFLVKNLFVNERCFLGSDKKHLKFFFSQDLIEKTQTFEAISFGGGEKFSTFKEGDQIDLVCNIQKNDWNGNSRVQLNIIDMKIS
ncbi:MAG: single-stranded-DNA-specific exonuclease RecJ, partial [Candidatus Moranbacteria bacterium]|nr:single-stranded-DNA-specific exonuclease RecJ [Candidatus Moranbacteria bacterium]